MTEDELFKAVQEFGKGWHAVAGKAPFEAGLRAKLLATIDEFVVEQDGNILIDERQWSLMQAKVAVCDAIVKLNEECERGEISARSYIHNAAIRAALAALRKLEQKQRGK